MSDMTSPSLPFILTDPDGLMFDDEPELFVHLDVSPIVFTVRGLRYFSPRFRMMGVDVARLTTREAFERTFHSWMELEASLLGHKLAQAAAAENLPAEYSILNSIWKGGLDAAELMCERMDRRKASALRIVAGSTREPPQTKR